MNLPFTYMPLPAVLQATGIGSKSTLYARIKAGKFPAPDRLEGASRWRSDRIAQWLLEQASQADAHREERARRAEAKALRMRSARQSA